MKVLNFVSSAVLFSTLVVSTAFGEGSEITSLKAAESSVREQIASSLSDVAFESQGEVSIYFSASPKAGFELIKITGTDNRLVNKVKSQLKLGRISIPSGVEGNYFVKVRFADSKNVVENVSTDEVLRSSISEALSKVDAGNGSVTLYFSVKGNKLSLKKAEGSDKSLVASVENTLNNSPIGLPADLTGNYQINVKF